jgi:hypothetical protein
MTTVLRDVSKETLGKVLEHFRAREVAPYWRLCAGDLPSDLEERLLKKDFTLVEEQPAMAADLQKLNEAVRTPDGGRLARSSPPGNRVGHHFTAITGCAGQGLPCRPAAIISHGLQCLPAAGV